MSGTSTGVADMSEVAYPPRARRRKSLPPSLPDSRCCSRPWRGGGTSEDEEDADAATAASCARTAVGGWTRGGGVGDYGRTNERTDTPPRLPPPPHTLAYYNTY